MSSNWLTNFDLFLHTKGSDDVQLWRLKKKRSLSSSSASSPILRLIPDDFEYVNEVKDHQKLIENMFQWNITDYNNLINYISTRSYLVNGEGMQIAEVLQRDEDGNIDPNELPVYFRSDNVLPLNKYIPSVQNRKKVKDVVVPPLVDDSNSTLQEKLDKERSDKQILAQKVADLEAENKTLETDVTKLKADLGTKRNENKTLEADVTKLKADLATRTKENADLQAENETCDVTKLEAELATKTKEIADLETENKTLETDVTKLKANLVTKTNEIADLEAEKTTLETDVSTLKRNLAAKTNEIADLEAGNKTMETDMAKLAASLAARTNEVSDLKTENKTLGTNITMLKADLAAQTKEIAAWIANKEVWMNDDFMPTNNDDWVGIEKLTMGPGEVSFTVIQNKGYFTKEDCNQTAQKITNISSRHWFQMKILYGSTYTAIGIDDLLPNKQKARFLVHQWTRLQSGGKTYVYR